MRDLIMIFSGMIVGFLVAWILRGNTILKWKLRYQAFRKNHFKSKHELFNYINSQNYKRSNGSKP